VTCRQANNIFGGNCVLCKKVKKKEFLLLGTLKTKNFRKNKWNFPMLFVNKSWNHGHFEDALKTSIKNKQKIHESTSFDTI